MLFSKILFGLFLSVSLVFALPVQERRSPGEADALVARKFDPNKPLQVGDAGTFTSQARKQNNAPGRHVPKLCKKVTDCKCPPRKPGSKEMHSTSCINGACSCDNKVVNMFAGKFLDAVKAIGNSAITKAIGGLMQGIADVKQVMGTIVGAALGPQARAALKAALMAIPDTGESHIDKATKGKLSKIL